jgi:hypothetical protein
MSADRLSDPGFLEWGHDYYPVEPDSTALMVRLLQRLQRKEYADLVPASTSLWYLVLGWESSDQLSVRCLRRGPKPLFHLRYWIGNTNRVQDFECEIEEAERLIDCLILRIYLRQRYERALESGAALGDFGG